MRPRSRRAVSGLTCQIGRRAASTAAVSTSATGIVHIARGLVFQGLSPLPAVLCALPHGFAVGQENLGRIAERHDRFWGLIWWGAAGFNRVHPTSDLLARRGRKLACAGQGDRDQGAETHLSPASGDAVEKRPALRAGCIHHEIQAAAIGVSANLRQRLHFSSGQAIDRAGHFTLLSTPTPDAVSRAHRRTLANGFAGGNMV